MGHTEQVPQNISLDARQAHQDYIVRGVMVCNVVNIRVRLEKFGAIVEIYPNPKRARLS